MSAQVYITQESRKFKDLDPAKKYGELGYITSLEYSMVKKSDNNAVIHSAIADTVGGINPDEDYILMLGDPIIIGLVIHKMLETHGIVRLLKWNNGSYYPVTISNQSIDKGNG